MGPIWKNIEVHLHATNGETIKLGAGPDEVLDRSSGSSLGFGVEKIAVGAHSEKGYTVSVSGGRTFVDLFCVWDIPGYTEKAKQKALAEPGLVPFSPEEYAERNADNLKPKARIKLGTFKVTGQLPHPTMDRTTLVMLSGQMTLFSPSWRKEDTDAEGHTQKREAHSMAEAVFGLPVSNELLPHLNLPIGATIELEACGERLFLSTSLHGTEKTLAGATP